MAATYDEVLLLRNQLIAEHGIETVELASMLLFFWYASGNLGVARDMNFPLLARCANHYMRDNGIPMKMLQDAIDGLERANKTLTYLASLPD